MEDLPQESTSGVGPEDLDLPSGSGIQVWLSTESAVVPIFPGLLHSFLAAGCKIPPDVAVSQRFAPGIISVAGLFSIL